MAWPAAKMFRHLPGILQKLLRVANHLWVAAQHHVAGFGAHWQTHCLFQGTTFN